MTAPNPERLRELVARLRYAATTEINDDRTEPMSDKRARMADRVEVMNDAHDAIDALLHQLAEERELRMAVEQSWQHELARAEAAERARGEAHAELQRSHDWFEAQAKVISKGCGSTWDLVQVREQRDRIAAFLAASGGK